MVVKKENYELVLYRLDQIDQKLDAMANNYVTKEEFESFKDEMRTELKRKNFASWVNPVIASISAAIVTFLVIEYLKRSG